MDDDDLVLLTITDVRVAVPAGNGVEAGLVVLEERLEPHRRLRLYVGQPEARAIHLSWSRSVPPRPSTWDLFISTISLLDARIERIILNDVEEERHYFAQMVVRQAEVDEPLLLAARPSDAIALALRAYGAKIYARPHVLDQAGLLADGTHWVRPPPDPQPEPEPEAEAYVAPHLALVADPGADFEDEPDPDGDQDEGLDADPNPNGDPVVPSAATRAAAADATLRAATERASAARAARSFAGRTPVPGNGDRP